MPHSNFLNIDLDHAKAVVHGAQVEGHDILLVDSIAGIDFSTKAFQTTFFTIAYCQRGEAQFSLNDRPQQLREGSLLFFLGSQVIDQVHTSPDFALVALLQSREYAHSTIQNLLHLWPYLLYLREHPVVALEGLEREWVEQAYHLLRQRINAVQHAFLNDSVKALLQVFYLDLCHIVEQRSPIHALQNLRASRIFYDFMALLSRHYLEQREVSWYAEQLHLTAKYLTEVVKEVSHRTASQWIATMVVIEIKSRLRHTDASVKEIASALNFGNQSFMGKYFKHHTGLTPIAYRRRGNK